MGELNRGYWDVKLKEVKSEDACTKIAGMGVVFWVWLWGRNFKSVVWILGLL